MANIEKGFLNAVIAHKQSATSLELALTKFDITSLEEMMKWPEDRGFWPLWLQLRIVSCPTRAVSAIPRIQYNMSRAELLECCGEALKVAGLNGTSGGAFNARFKAEEEIVLLMQATKFMKKLKDYKSSNENAVCVGAPVTPASSRISELSGVTGDVRTPGTVTTPLSEGLDTKQMPRVETGKTISEMITTGMDSRVTAERIKDSDRQGNTPTQFGIASGRRSSNLATPISAKYAQEIPRKETALKYATYFDIENEIGSRSELMERSIKAKDEKDKARYESWLRNRSKQKQKRKKKAKEERNQIRRSSGSSEESCQSSLTEDSSWSSDSDFEIHTTMPDRKSRRHICHLRVKEQNRTSKRPLLSTMLSMQNRSWKG